jgi:hypothetical protein
VVGALFGLKACLLILLSLLLGLVSALLGS